MRWLENGQINDMMMLGRWQRPVFLNLVWAIAHDLHEKNPMVHHQTCFKLDLWPLHIKSTFTFPLTFPAFVFYLTPPPAPLSLLNPHSRCESKTLCRKHNVMNYWFWEASEIYRPELLMQDFLWWVDRGSRSGPQWRVRWSTWAGVLRGLATARARAHLKWQRHRSIKYHTAGSSCSVWQRGFTPAKPRA